MGGRGRTLLHALPALACEGAWWGGRDWALLHAPHVCVRADVGDRRRALLHAHPAFECEGVSRRGSRPVCRMHSHAFASERGARVGRPRAVAHSRVCERDFESEGGAVEAPQPHMVEAMCKANWPAQKRPTKRARAPKC